MPIQRTCRHPIPTLVVCIALWSSGTSATILAPGAFINLNGTTVAAEPDLAGTVIHDNLIDFQVNDISGNPLFTGTYQDRVVRSDNTGNLIFAGRIRDLTSPLEHLVAVADWSVDGFAGYQTDVEYRTDGLGDLGPDTATRTADGNFVTFDFTPVLAPPEESLFSSINTDARFFALTGTVNLGIEDFTREGAYVVGLEGIAAPAAAVPLPATIWLFGSGLIGLAGVVRRQHNSAG